MISKKIKLINCDRKILESIFQGNKDLSKYLNINVIDKWTEFGEQIFGLSLKKVIENPNSKKWYIYLPIETKSNTLIGSMVTKVNPMKMELLKLDTKLLKNSGIKGMQQKLLEF